jgi:O-antigen/teichoic acid export membrane protein
MFNYSWPILLVGVTGIFNQYGSQILFPLLIDDPVEAGRQLGVYGANYKIAVIMVMFVQAFRFAYEPFIFRSSKNSDARLVYAHVMKVFVIVGMFIFLSVTLFIDVVKYFIGSNYHAGVNVVPIVLMGNLFFGIYFNLSVWYKLNDKTYIGSLLAIMGSIITIVVVVLFLPIYGFIAAAWANLICFGIMMIVSYLLERKYFSIPYDTKRIGIYFSSGIILFLCSFFVSNSYLMLKYTLHGFIVLVFLGLVLHFEKISLQQIKNVFTWRR